MPANLIILLLNEMPNNKRLQRYNIDIITTDGCNFRCKYCVEAGFFDKHNKFENVSIETLKALSEKIDYFLEHNWFKSNFSGVRVNFWGGEPTLNMPGMEFLINKYMDDPRIIFYVFTNGYKIDKLIPLIQKCNRNTDLRKNEQKFGMQISYDGKPIQDLQRVTKQGNATSETVRNNIKKCVDADIPFVIHPVVTVDTFKYMYESYLDYFDLYKYAMNRDPGNNTCRNISYSPNLDYFNDNSNVFKEEYLTDIYDNMLKIAQHKKEHLNPNHQFFNWLSPQNQKALCSVGTNITAVDSLGDFYVCHGAFFQTDETIKKKFYVGSLSDDNEDWVNKLRRVSDSCKVYHFKTPDKCNDCDAKICLRCQIVASVKSNKSTFWEQWIDYNAGDFNCKLFKLITYYSNKINKLVD